MSSVTAVSNKQLVCCSVSAHTRRAADQRELQCPGPSVDRLVPSIMLYPPDVHVYSEVRDFKGLCRGRKGTVVRGDESMPHVIQKTTNESS